MGYTESRISQLHSKAVIKMRIRLAKKMKAEDLPEWLKDTKACGN
jgi:RNA polymerase sigma factor for flagellar operon FliA